VTETLPRLVFFYSSRSGASRRAEPFVAQVLQRRHNHDTFTLVRVDVDARPELAERFKIDVVPTVLVIDGNRVQARVRELKGVRELAEALGPWLH
jgi:thioredoxin-like negative regulator of GroEL